MTLGTNTGTLSESRTEQMQGGLSPELELEAAYFRRAVMG